MKRIAFFCIPAHGHTNPTLEVVKQLVQSGCSVRYYSYDIFKEKIQSTGAQFVSCDKYDNQLNLSPQDGARIAKDVAFSTRVLVETTLAMDDALLQDIKAFAPHCIVADSMAMWGKLIAWKLDIPFVSSTTTFAFNQHSAKVMKQDLSQLFTMMLAMPKVNKSLQKLRDKGYPVKNILSVIQNDNDTNTVVYTSKEFQPCSETFSDRYHFVGPSIRPTENTVEKEGKKLVYISMGTVNNNMLPLYKNCVAAFKNSDCRVVMAVGDMADITALGDIPHNITVEKYVDQIAVLKAADVFVTHCGMNSVSEALYFAVPLIMLPQTTEQQGVANRVHQLGAGVYLKNTDSDAIKATVEKLLKDKACRAAAESISKSFKNCGGAAQAAQAILAVASE